VARYRTALVYCHVRHGADGDAGDGDLGGTLLVLPAALDGDGGLGGHGVRRAALISACPVRPRP
jgi:hypothetical protein